MSETSFLKRRWKVLVNVATGIALLVLVYAIRGQLAETLRNLARVHGWALLAIIPIQVVNYHAQAKMYQGLFQVVGNKLRYRFLFIVSLELNFVNHVFPSGGVSGISYFGARMKNSQISGSKAALVQMMKLVLYFLSFEVLLVFGLLAMAIGNHVNDVVIMVTTLISTVMVISTAGFVMIIGSENRIRATFTTLTRLVNRIIHVARPKHPETIRIVRIERIVMDLHANYKLIESRYRELKMTLFWAFMANLTEVLTVYVVYLAFGRWVNIGSIILAYAVANFAGLVSVMPGGVGIYEALMTGVLVAAGIPAGVSLPVTVMYRVLNTALQLPPGYYFYHRNLHRQQNDTQKLREMHDD
jgi:uncharacterized protein (TIRG00374 family)